MTHDWKIENMRVCGDDTRVVTYRCGKCGIGWEQHYDPYHEELPTPPSGPCLAKED